MDWRSWSASDRAAVVYLLLHRQHQGDKVALRDLYELVGDKAAVAQIDNAIIHQSQTVMTDR